MMRAGGSGYAAGRWAGNKRSFHAVNFTPDGEEINKDVEEEEDVPLQQERGTQTPVSVSRERRKLIWKSRISFSSPCSPAGNSQSQPIRIVKASAVSSSRGRKISSTSVTTHRRSGSLLSSSTPNISSAATVANEQKASKVLGVVFFTWVFFPFPSFLHFRRQRQQQQRKLVPSIPGLPRYPARRQKSVDNGTRPAANKHSARPFSTPVSSIPSANFAYLRYITVISSCPGENTNGWSERRVGRNLYNGHLGRARRRGDERPIKRRTIRLFGSGARYCPFGKKGRVLHFLLHLITLNPLFSSHFRFQTEIDKRTLSRSIDFRRQRTKTALELNSFVISKWSQRFAVSFPTNSRNVTIGRSNEKLSSSSSLKISRHALCWDAK